jgi:hypothetical protein
MHNPGVSRRGIEKSCLRTIPRPSSPATGLAHRAAIQTLSFPDAQLRIVDGASAPDRVCVARSLKTESWKWIAYRRATRSYWTA